MLYKKVEMNTPNTVWLIRSLINPSNSLGPYWEEANERTTIVIEKTTPAIVIIEPAIVERTALALSAPAEKNNQELKLKWLERFEYKYIEAHVNKKLVDTNKEGINHKLELIDSINSTIFAFIDIKLK